MSILQRVTALLDRITLDFFAIEFRIRVDYEWGSSPDFMNSGIGACFIQIQYFRTGSMIWEGRKWIIQNNFSDDQIVKTIYAAYEAAIKHEVMKSFRVDNITIFDPQLSFEELVKLKK